MTGFSPDWLALREGVDHRSRARALERRLVEALAAKNALRIVDLGSGTGSNLRALAPLLAPEQHWTLVDHDPVLLEEAALALARWAEAAETTGDALVLHKGNKRIRVDFRLHDLAGAVEDAVVPGCDLLTASALYDLTSALWMGRLARAVAGVGAAFYAVLTYDGRDSFSPAHPLDGAMVEAFARHMQRDKGFGVATGPMAADVLAGSLRQVGYTVERGDSPWVLVAEDATLTRALCTGMAAAVGETNTFAPAALADWLRFRMDEAVAGDARMETGHTDILAIKAL